MSLAGAMKYIKDFQKGLPSFPDGSIIWSISDDKPDYEVYILYNEQLSSLSEKFKSKDSDYFYILPLNAVEEYHYQFPDKSFEILKYIDNSEK